MLTKSQYIDEAIKRPVRDHNTYATDGKCHNAQRGTYGHECGKPATWIGTKASGFQSGFCDDCKQHGDERHGFETWARVEKRTHVTGRLAVGQAVTYSGFPGTVARLYADGETEAGRMYEVRLPGGLACVCGADLIPA